jgi:hypothetical protein
MGLSTAKIKAEIIARFTDRDLVQIGRVDSWTDSLVLEDYQDEKTWKRIKKFKRKEGQVVRYFTVSAPDYDYEKEPVCKVVSDSKDSGILEMTFGAVRELSDFYFAFVDSYDERAVTVTTKDYWDKEGYVDDQSYANPYVPDELMELMESLYEFEGTEEETRKRLLALGFTENPKMTHFGN